MATDPNEILRQSKQILNEAATFTERLFDKRQAYNSVIAPSFSRDLAACLPFLRQQPALCRTLS